MRTVKSFLLGSAAGLVAVTAGQAADLPVKAKPVEYVKVCSLYGAGFYYMPGTDMCLKIGGWVRSEISDGINGNSANGLFNNDVNNRYTNNFWSRERGYITADAREQTAYGVARAYIAVGISSQNQGNEVPASQANVNRAFVQWAGFTAGLSLSFYDFYPAGNMLIRAFVPFSEDTGDGGWWVWGYTAQFGGGFSGTISAEGRRVGQIISQSTADTIAASPPGTAGALPGGTFGAADGYGGWQSPDIVANLRVDQAWGGAQIMGALHEVNPGYYSAPTTLVTNGHPSDQWGWVVGAGLKVNTPFVTPGDFLIGEVNYTQGAPRYLNHGANGESQLYQNGGTEGFGVSTDCVYGGSVAAGNASGCNLTTAWSFNVAYEHYWTPQWHESLVGGYYSESYNASANAMLCSLIGAGNGAGIGTAATATAGCNNNWAFWGVGSRLQWDITKNFYVSGEVIYQDLQSATTFNGLVPASLQVGTAAGPLNDANQSNWVFSLRMHKDFLP